MNQTLDRRWHSATLLAAITALAATGGCAGSIRDTAQLEQTTLEQPEQTEADGFDSMLNAMSEAQVPDTPLLDYQSPEDTVAASPEGTPPIVNPVPTGGSPGARSNTGFDVQIGDEAQSQAIAPETDTPDNADPGDGLAIGSGSPEPPSIDSRIEDAVRSLRTLIADSGDQALSPMGAMLRIALLESVQPGVFAATYGSIEDAAEFANLTPEEREVLDSTLELASTLRGELDPGLVDLDRVVHAIERAGDEMRAVKLLTIDDARFCLRVDGYGVYREATRHEDRYKFIAGSPHRLIVYTELDHFTRSPGSRNGLDGYVVNMKQGLELYLVGTEDAPDSQHTLVLQHDPQIIVDFSQRPRRDFFIAQIIDLPHNLSLGSYRLKVITTDIATGEQVERGIDFDMVAHAGAFKGAGLAKAVDTGPYDPDR